MEELFDLSEEYDAMLNQGLSASGESKMYFIEGRLQDLKAQLEGKGPILRILDFGCGIGDATARLLAYFPDATQVLGTDLSEEALDFARKKHRSEKLLFVNLKDLENHADFDLCYVNGVFHHIEPENRAQAIGMIYRSLKKGAYLALCENNPFNPGTQYIMSRIPFDRDAKKINPYACQALVRSAGFEKIISTRFLFYFPRFLSGLRFLERYLTSIPLGGQYYVLGKK